MLHTLCFFFSSKCLLFHNATFFGPCIIHILNTGVIKLKRKFRRQRVRIVSVLKNCIYEVRCRDMCRNNPQYVLVKAYSTCFAMLKSFLTFNTVLSSKCMKIHLHNTTRIATIKQETLAIFGRGGVDQNTG